MTKHIAVLMGGWSAEREVSLVSGASCANALKEAGYEVTSIDVQRDMAALMTRLYPTRSTRFATIRRIVDNSSRSQSPETGTS